VALSKGDLGTKESFYKLSDDKCVIILLHFHDISLFLLNDQLRLFLPARNVSSNNLLKTNLVVPRVHIALTLIFFWHCQAVTNPSLTSESLSKMSSMADEMQHALMENSISSLTEGMDCPLDDTIPSLSTLTSHVVPLETRRPPERRREIRKTRSLLVEMDISPSTTSSPRSSVSTESIESDQSLTPATPNRRKSKSGTLTFAKSISELKRAGSSREVGPLSPKPTRRKAPNRSQSCVLPAG
jgi:hypothetical protein